ncbi:hypothetical protein V6N13_103194 [Hibiscus sabdariffa]
MKGLNQVSSSVTRKQSTIEVKAVKYTRRTLIHKSLNLLVANAAIDFSSPLFRSWKKKKRVVAVSRVMSLRGRLRAFLMEVKPALPAAVARTQHLFPTESAMVSGVARTAGVFVEHQWMVMTHELKPRHVLSLLFMFFDLCSKATLASSFCTSSQDTFLRFDEIQHTFFGFAAFVSNQ